MHSNVDVQLKPYTQSIVPCHPCTKGISSGYFVTTGHFPNHFSSCLAGGRLFQHYSPENASEFKILVCNTTPKQVTIHKNARLGHFTQIQPEDGVINISDWFSNESTDSTHSSTDTSKINEPEIKTVTPSDSVHTSQNTFPPIQHDLSHCTHLSTSEKEQLSKLLLDYDAAFLHPAEKLGTTHLMKHKIQVPDNPPV